MACDAKNRRDIGDVDDPGRVRTDQGDGCARSLQQRALPWTGPVGGGVGERLRNGTDARSLCTGRRWIGDSLFRPGDGKQHYAEWKFSYRGTGFRGELQHGNTKGGD